MHILVSEILNEFYSRDSAFLEILFTMFICLDNFFLLNKVNTRVNFSIDYL
jgi:hypothetical protein